MTGVDNSYATVPACRAKALGAFIHKKFIFLCIQLSTRACLAWYDCPSVYMANILLIEDDELIQHMYQQVLGMRGHQVTTAQNGEHGLELAHTQPFDLILLDIVMPKLNGIDMLKQLRATPAIAKSPVMILTNVMNAGDAATAREAGVLRYVIKSDYTPNEVASMVENLLKGRKPHTNSRDNTKETAR